MNQAKKCVMMAVSCCLAIPGGLRAQQLKPQTEHDFECYIQSAEERMAGRKAFLLADSDAVLNEQLVRGRRIQTVAINGANPHKIAGGQVYDWIGAVFIPGVTVDRVVGMLQDYDHRAQYFTEVMSASKLLCRTGEERFGYSMRLKEPAVIDAENDVVWERLDAHRWRCRSYSTSVKEVGKDHGYLRRLYSYWRLAEVEKGVYVEGQTVTLSDEFGGLTRAIGSMMGINPEKSLKRSLTSIREAVLKTELQFAKPPAGQPACGPPVIPTGCAVTARK